MTTSPMTKPEIIAVRVCTCPWANSERIPDPDCPVHPWSEQVAARLAARMFPDTPGCGNAECRGCRHCGWDTTR